MPYFTGHNVRVGVAANCVPSGWDSSIKSDPAADIALEARLILIRTMRKRKPRVIAVTRDVWFAMNAWYLMKWNWFSGFNVLKKRAW